MICERCKKETGNNTQGHFWSRCSVTKKIEEFHFCCPNDCELKQDLIYKIPSTGKIISLQINDEKISINKNINKNDEISITLKKE